MNLGDYLKKEQPEKYRVLKVNQWGTEDLTAYARYFLMWKVINVMTVKKPGTEEVVCIFIGDWE